MLGKDRCLELVEAALAACESDQAEVVLYTTEHSLTRFAESVIHQNVTERNARLSVRAVLGKRVGAARSNQLNADEARVVARRAREIAAVTAEDKEFVSLPSPQPLPEVRAYAEATAASTPEARAAAAREVVAVTQRAKCVASGSLSAEWSEVAIGNSLGVRAYAPSTQASLVVVAADEPASGYAEWHGMDLAQLDAAAAGETAARLCVESRGAEAIAPGPYTVILQPAAVTDMLSMLGWVGLGANAYQEGRSFLSGRLGEKVMGENVSLWDDGTDLRGLAFPFDWEGMPKRKVMLIEKGVARGVVHDSYTAGRDHAVNTGHALPAPNTYGPLPLNLFLGTGDTSLQEMIGSTARGLLVTRFHYTNIIHEKQTILTGMTRDGTFVIENGKLARPVQNLRFTQSITEALSNVEQVGRDGRLTEGGYAPALKIAGFNFTS